MINKLVVSEIDSVVNAMKRNESYNYLINYFKEKKRVLVMELLDNRSHQSSWHSKHRIRGADPPCYDSCQIVSHAQGGPIYE